jgi:hypothetical protein
MVNFRTIYKDSKTDDEVHNGTKIALKYLLYGRFWIDMLASLPIEMLELLFGSNANFKFLGMIKLIRLLRLGRMITFMKANQKLKLGMKIFQLIFMLIMCIHWINCAWYYVTVIEKTWFPAKDLDFGETIVFNSGEGDQYILLFYYAVLTLVANDLIPTNSTELISAFFLVFVGIIIIGIAIGEFAALLSAITKKERERSEEMDVISSVMLNLKIPEEVQNRVVEYYDEMVKACFIKNDDLYNKLSMTLADLVKMYQMEKTIKSLNFINENNHW